MNNETGQMESRLHTINMDFPTDGSGRKTLGYLIECIIMLNDRVKELEGHIDDYKKEKGLITGW